MDAMTITLPENTEIIPADYTPEWLEAFRLRWAQKGVAVVETGTHLIVGELKPEQ